MSCMEGPRYAMNSGDGPHSYVQNSSYQGSVLDVAKPVIEEAIATKLDIIITNNINIADFGCSTGHNSFAAMQIITQSINQKSDQSTISKMPEFYVYFNDLQANDFNTLVSSLPLNRRYRAVIVPGDFHNRVLQESSLHFAYCSWALHWLTRVPEAVAKRDLNKGQVLWSTRERRDACDAHFDQFSRDMKLFLEARAIEMVSGGLMALLIPGLPESWNPKEEYTIVDDHNLLGSCLVDMARKGRFDESMVDSFNFPFYLGTPQQLKAILEMSHSFTTERIEIINNPKTHTMSDENARASFHRAALEGVLTNHFGSKIIIDELFNLYRKKLIASPVLMNPDNDKNIVLLAILKRKPDLRV